jgi:hypothetical protein
MDLSRHPERVFGILLSEQDEGFADFFAEITHQIAPRQTTIAVTVPKTAREEDVLETATAHQFHLIILFLNNIIYSSGDRDQVPEDSVALVRKLSNLFGTPIIGVSGCLETPEYFSHLREAGAVAAFPMPWDNLEMQKVLTQYIPPR